MSKTSRGGWWQWIGAQWCCRKLGGLWEDLAGWFVSVPGGLDKLYSIVGGAPVARDESDFETLHRVYDRVESLHQALCVSAFIGAAASFVRIFQPVLDNPCTNTPSENSLQNWYIAGSVVLFTVGILLRHAVMLAADEDGMVRHARIAIGACSPVAQRALTLESNLIGRPLDAGLAELAVAETLAMLEPIDDVRASAAYRRHAALILVRRALRELGENQ